MVERRYRMERTWLREARTKAGKTQEEVAKELDISDAYYSMIELGKRQNPMDLMLCLKLSKIFSIPIKRIVEFETKEEA